MHDVDRLPLEAAQLSEVAEMLRDIRKIRMQSLGEEHIGVAEAACVLSLLYISLQDAEQAVQSLHDAQHNLLQEPVSGKLGMMLSIAQAGLQLVQQGL